MQIDSDSDYGLFCSPDQDIGLPAVVTDRQGMLTPRHLIRPLVFPGVRVSTFNVVFLTGIIRFNSVRYLYLFYNTAQEPYSAWNI